MLGGTYSKSKFRGVGKSIKGVKISGEYICYFCWQTLPASDEISYSLDAKFSGDA